MTELMREQPVATVTPEPTRQRRLFGEMLLERELISSRDLEAALKLQRTTGRRLGETLVALGLVSSGNVMRVLAQRLGLDYVEMTEITIDSIVAQAVPEEVARRYRVLPISRQADRVTVVMHEPSDVFAIDDLAMMLEATVVPVLADADQLDAAINRVWAGSNIQSTVHEASGGVADIAELTDLLAVAEEAPIVRMVNAILAQAVAERASDVHLEPTPNRLRVRFRIDGVLHDTSDAPLTVHRPAVSRLKIMAGIDIAKTRLPQDGRFSVTVNERNVDVRMATLPTAHGEAAILRLLDKTSGVIELRALGFSPHELDEYRSAFTASQGVIMTSGPTGSGKTSTLYATLLEIDSTSRNVIAVEDPIEYRIEGIKQVQVETRAGLTFPTALRSILRSDPDVILIGEIRDLETARIAAEASLTGHLVFSTIHTTSAAAVPLRLIDMGVEPFLVTSALTAVVGQRLVRRLCDCAEPSQPDEATRISLGLPDELLDAGTIRRAVGCSHCSGTGYFGRIGIYEVMRMSPDICRMVSARADRRDIERWAVSEGMDTLRMAALQRVADGTLSIDELVRAIA
ncbi:MAG: GspE/PulE family protein [Acidimicrobiia bacterium]